MGSERHQAIEDAIEHLLKAREGLKAHASSKTLLLLDMLLIDLGEQLAAIIGGSTH